MAFEYLADRAKLPSNSRYRNHRLVSQDGKKTMESWNRPTIEPQPDDTLYRVGAGEEFRIDLIAHKIYRDVALWWAIALANNIIDPVAEITVRRQLRIPSKRYLFERVLL